MKLVVTGASGMTGSELVRQAVAQGWECTGFSRADLDVTDSSAVERFIARERPDVVINAAAFTAVDAAEARREEAMAVNGPGAGNVARAATLNGAAVIHISTDYVFNGESSVPYKPDDPVAPIGAYGESKLAGEIAVREQAAHHAIVRTSWVYSHEGKNFVRTMLQKAAEGLPIRVVNDQHGSPTSASDLAAALLGAAWQMKSTGALCGTYHFSNSGDTTWYGFANEIFAQASMTPEVVPVSTDQYPTAAARPRWSVLDTTSFTQTFGLTPRSWRNALSDIIARIT
jgi:dTDP-4-dehydrorhamnose reductase